MRACLKVVTIVTLLLTVFACGKKSETVFLEKDGTLYEVADQVSFYYPKDFKMDTSVENKAIVQFVRKQEVMSYQTIIDDTDNEIDDMPELYAGQLEEDGAIDVGYKNLKIDSGLNCQEFTGTYQSTGIKFKHLVYFTANSEYVLSYQAPQKVYDDEISIISQYLNSLKVHKEE